MNFGNNAGSGYGSNQEATYQLAPNFTTRPSPKGPWTVGIVVEDLKQFAPLNSKDQIVPISELYNHELRGISASANNTSDGNVGFLAKVLDQSIGGEASLQGKKSKEDVYEIARLRTDYFYPRAKYLQAVLELPDVKDYLEETSYRAPIYLITGLKTAFGATVSMERGKSKEINTEVGAMVPGSVDIGITTNAGAHKSSGTSSSHTGSTDFVLAMQVVKLHHKKKLFSGDKVLKKELVTKGAVLVDDEPSDTRGDNEGNEDFVISALDNSEHQASCPDI